MNLTLKGYIWKEPNSNSNSISNSNWNCYRSQPSGRIERVELQNRCRQFEFELELELVPPPGVKFVVDSKFDLELELRFHPSGRQNCRRLEFELKLELVPPPGVKKLSSIRSRIRTNAAL